MNIVPLTVLTACWVGILLLLFRGLRIKMAEEQSEESLVLSRPKPQPEDFPKWFNTLWYALLILFIAFFIFAMFAFPLGLSFLQKLIFGRGSLLFLAPNTILITLLPSLFLGIIAGGLGGKFIISLFPKFDQYQAFKDVINRNTMGLSKERREEVWNEAVSKVDLKKHAQKEWSQMFLGGLIIWMLVGPIYILAMDDYIALKEDGIVNNPFVRLQEEKYNWQDIKESKLFISTSRDKKGKVSISPHLNIITNNGQTIDLWNGVGFGSPSEESLITAVNMLHSKGVKLNIEPFKNQDALMGYTSEVQKTVTDVFNQAESLNN